MTRMGVFEEFRGDSSGIAVAEAVKFLEKHVGGGKPMFALVWFKGNTHNNVANAIYLENHDSNNTLALTAKDGQSIFFYDPVESNSANPNLTVHINSTDGTADGKTSGTVLFDTHQSKVYGNTTVYGGTMKLTNVAIYGADTNNDTFTLNSGATLSGTGTVTGSSTWNTTTTNTNWTPGNFATYFKTNDTVIFDDSHATSKAVSVDGNGVSVSGMTVSGSGYEFTGGKITGSGALTLSEDVTFKNQFTGFTGATIAAGKTLTIDTTAAGWTMTTALTGAGNLTKTGTGDLALSNDVTLAAFNLNAGSLSLASGKNLTGNFDAAAGATLKVVTSTITGNSTLAAGSNIEAAPNGTDLHHRRQRQNRRHRDFDEATRLFGDYDFDLGDRSTSHTGQFGLVTNW